MGLLAPSAATKRFVDMTWLLSSIVTAVFMKHETKCDADKSQCERKSNDNISDSSTAAAAVSLQRGTMNSSGNEEEGYEDFEDIEKDYKPSINEGGEISKR